MSEYLREQSAGEIIRASFGIYGKNFLRLFSIYLIPVLPIIWLRTVVEESALGVLGVGLLYWFMNMFALAAMTVAVSDICLGSSPSVVRSYRKILGRIPVKLIATNLLFIVILVIGLLLLVVPFVVFYIWFLFAPTVVVLEGAWGVGALKRSRALGKNHFWRILGIFSLLLIIAFVTGGLIGVVLALTAEELIEHWAVGGVVESLAAPLGAVGLVLLYYDLRVRKEAYDIDMLSQDLRR